MQSQQTTGTKTPEEFEAEIADQLVSGKNRTDVVRELVQSGMSESEAHQAVERLYFEMKKTAEAEEFSAEVVPFALLGGLIAALIGGMAWGGIAIWTGLEIGYVAWGVGLLCGVGVVMMSQGKRGMPLQMIAVVTSVLGILIGKYIFFYNFYNTLAQASGGEIAEITSMISMDGVQHFAANLTLMASGFDLLWIGLAVYTAWSIPKASGIKI